MADLVPTENKDIAARNYVRKVTRASGSTFYWGMRILPEDKRDAMFTIYTFCREVDDIADGTKPPEQKLADLNHWRRSLETIYDHDDNSEKTLLEYALSQAVQRYSLEKNDFTDVIAGMEMDADGSMMMPDCARLQQYCDRVAGAVGLLSIRVFGDTSAASRKFALSLGTALQLTNILRDLKDDALMGRLYLPKEQIIAQNVSGVTPDDVLTHPKLPEICRAVAKTAQNKYLEAGQLLSNCDIRALKPAVIMMMNYRRVLERLLARDWRDLNENIGLSIPQKLWITCRYGLF
ncbi:MAG: presqualene diphosphate synthase HpnD [Pseudomonadota bacterium]|nr:presqualene diphosphate synthase HpnD [Pseudomonadota bacterium]